jgi:HAD superfamily hydrolase (TIGR01509 family)
MAIAGSARHRRREICLLIGTGGDKILAQVGIDDESDRGRSIAARRKHLFRERYLAGCRPFPGARDLVARMREDGLVIAVATSSEKDDLAALLHVAGVHHLIDESATSSDAKHSKPDPDIVVAAARRTKLEPELLVMLGDTPYDVEAAARAGRRGPRGRRRNLRRAVATPVAVRLFPVRARSPGRECTDSSSRRRMSARREEARTTHWDGTQRSACTRRLDHGAPLELSHDPTSRGRRAPFREPAAAASSLPSRSLSPSLSAPLRSRSR